MHGHMGQMWWIVYMDGAPSVMVQTETGEQAINGLREAMLGKKLPKLSAQNILEAPIEDVARASFAALLTISTALAAAAGFRPGPKAVS